MVEVPGNDAVQLPLSVLAAFNDRPPHIDGGVSVQPLFSEHCEEGGEERSGEACVKDGLYLDDCVWGTEPLRDRRNVAAKCHVVDLVDEDAEEGGRLFIRV